MLGSVDMDVKRQLDVQNATSQKIHDERCLNICHNAVNHFISSLSNAVNHFIFSLVARQKLVQHERMRDERREAPKVTRAAHEEAVATTPLAPRGDTWRDGTLLDPRDGLMQRLRACDEDAGVAVAQVRWRGTAAKHSIWNRRLTSHAFMTNRPTTASSTRGAAGA